MDSSSRKENFPPFALSGLARGPAPWLVRTLLFLATVTPALMSEAHARLNRTGQAEVRFLANGPAGLKIEGRDNKLSVEEDGESFKITAPLSDLKTGIALRDRHMREKYLEVSKYPEAVLVVPKSEVRLPAGGESKGQAKGMFTLHGVSKPMIIEYAIVGNDGAYKVNGTFLTNFTEHGIAVPSFLGVTVKPEVEVSVSFETIDKP